MSATPWNLLTKTSRFPVDRIGYNVKTSKYEFAPQNILEKTQLINSSDFFHVKWSMAYDKEYETGRDVRLMVRSFIHTLSNAFQLFVICSSGPPLEHVERVACHPHSVLVRGHSKTTNFDESGLK